MLISDYTINNGNDEENEVSTAREKIEEAQQSKRVGCMNR